MDIAKIRKKLKETDPGGKQPGADSKAAEQQAQATKDNENISTPSADLNQTPEQIGYQTASRDRSPVSDPASSGNETFLNESGKSIEHEPVAGPTKKEPASGKELRIPGEEIPSQEDNEKTEVNGGESSAEEIIEILTFRLFKEEFAFQISQLKEILKYQRITKVPKMPDYVVGITSLRGKVIPVIDLRTKVSSHAKLPDITNRIKILIIQGPKGVIGAVVDKVIGVVRIAKSEILPPPSHLTEEQLKFIDGIAIIDKRFVSILNMEETITIHFN
jgi:purine-binding chemotaxis protein CheW